MNAPSHDRDAVAGDRPTTAMPSRPNAEMGRRADVVEKIAAVPNVVAVRRVWRGLFAVQGFVAAYLVYLRLRAIAQGIGHGDHYHAPFYHLLAVVDWVGGVMSLAALLAAVLLPPPAWIDRLVFWLGRRRVIVACGIAIVLAVMSITIHQAYPFTMDEYAPAFQAQIFATGRLVAGWPPGLTPILVSPGFRSNGAFLDVSTVTGQACSDYAPGHAMLLTPLTWLGMPWAYNAVLAGVSLLLMATIAEKLFGPQAAGWSMLLAIASPVYAAYGMSFYAMMSHCTLNLLYVWLLLSPTLPRVAGAGLVGGFALVLHNPFPHTVFALPWILWLAMSQGRLWRLAVIGCCYAAVFLPIEYGWRSVEARVRSDTPIGSVSHPINASVSSAAETEPAAPEATPANEMSASPGDPFPKVKATWQSLLALLREYGSVLSPPSLSDLVWGRWASLLRLVAWDAPGLLVLATIASWRHRHDPRVNLLVSSSLATFFAYVLISMSGGHGWGYRYFFPAWGCLPILAAGFSLPAGRLPHRVADSADDSLLRRIGLAAILSLSFILPVRCWQIHGLISEHRRQLPPLAAPPDLQFGPWFAVAFIDPSKGYFRSDLIRNDPYLRTGPYIFASQGDTEDERVVNTLARQYGLSAVRTYAGEAGSAWLVLPQAAATRIAPGM